MTSNASDVVSASPLWLQGHLSVESKHLSQSYFHLTTQPTMFPFYNKNHLLCVPLVVYGCKESLLFDIIHNCAVLFEETWKR